MNISPELSEIVSQLEQQAITDGIQKKVVGAVIDIRGKVLVVIRAANEEFMAGLAEIPSGGVDAGENLLQALERETQEESGLGVKAVRKYLGSFDYTSGSGKKARQFNFLVEPDGENVQISTAEHSSFEWRDPQDAAGLKNMNMSDETIGIIGKAFEPEA